MRAIRLPSPLAHSPIHLTPYTLSLQASLVKLGKFAEAEACGNDLTSPLAVPLGVPTESLSYTGSLSEGAQATVFRGHWLGRDVAIKKAIIREAVGIELDRRGHAPNRSVSPSLRLSVSPSLTRALRSPVCQVDLVRFRREVEMVCSPTPLGPTPRLTRALVPSHVPSRSLARSLASFPRVRTPMSSPSSLRACCLPTISRSWRSSPPALAKPSTEGSGRYDIRLADCPPFLPPFPRRDCSPRAHHHHRSLLILLPCHQPEVDQILLIGSSIALVLSHLHNRDRPIVHRDVKPGNILLNSDRAVLADFGIADYQDAIDDEFSGNKAGRSPSGGFHKAKMLGTLEYMAPEILLKAGPASPASDVYALCVTVNELLARAFPYSDCTRDNPLAHTILDMGYGRQELATAVAAEGLRPSVPPGVPAEAAAVLRSGWHADPSQRPTAATIARALHRIATSTSTKTTSSTTRPTRANDIDDDVNVVNDAESVVFSLAGIDALNHAGRDPSDLSDSRADDAPADEWTAPDPPSWVRRGPPGDARPSTTVPIGVFATSGAREAMEDRGIILHQACMSDDVLVAAIFDGHRGAEASDFLAANLERLLRLHWTSSESAADLLTKTLLSAEDEFRRREERHRASTTQTRFPGTTAVCMLLHGDALTVANVGDSRAMVCRGDRAIDLTVDQVAGRADERERIERAGHGGTLRQHDGEWRVGDVGLAVTRSIGDFDAKPVLTAEPEITEHTVGPDDRYIVMASDGVWDVLGGQDVVSIIADTVKHPAMAAQRLVHTAVNERYSKDNATAVVCFLQNQSTFERV